MRDEGYFATAVGATLNAATGELRYVRAGHPAPLLIRANEEIMPLPARSPALGMFGEVPYVEGVETLARGETLVVYTDGAVEITNHAGQQFGWEGLVGLLQKEAHREIQLDSVEEQPCDSATTSACPMI